MIILYKNSSYQFGFLIVAVVYVANLFFQNIIDIFFAEVFKVFSRAYYGLFNSYQHSFKGCFLVLCFWALGSCVENVLLTGLLIVVEIL